MGRAVIAAGLVGLAACTPPIEPAPVDFTPIPVFSAQSIGPIQSGISALALAPNASIPWEGRLVIAPRNGGLLVYSIEGIAGFQTDGPLYTALALQAGFDLRKLKTGLLLAVTEDGKLEPMIIDDARGQVFMVPVADLPATDIVGVCALQSIPGTPKFALLRKNGDFELWQIADLGEELLQAKRLKTAKLAVQTNNCSASNGQVFATGIAGGIFAIDTHEKPVIDRGVDLAIGNAVAVSPSAEMTSLLHAGPSSTTLGQFNAKMQQTASLSLVQSLSHPAVSQPGALAVSDWSFGGAGFSAGLLAIADDSNNRVSLVVRDTLPGFAHHQEAP